MTFQSRRPGLDLVWQPGDPPADLPRSDTLVALWGITAGDNVALRGNVDLLDRTFDIARSCGAKRVLHFSTAGVYGPGTRLSEETPPAPASEYGRSKLAMERRIDRLRADSDADHIILRLANVVGADSLAPALRGPRPVTLDRFADGNGPKRSYVAASDVLRLVCHLAGPDGSSCPPVLNVAAAEPVDMAALAQAAGKRIIWRPAPETAIQNVSLDVARLDRLMRHPQKLSRAEDMVADWMEMETLS